MSEMTGMTGMIGIVEKTWMSGIIRVTGIDWTGTVWKESVWKGSVLLPVITRMTGIDERLGNCMITGITEMTGIGEIRRTPASHAIER
jgi:hypothetical protein